MMKKTFYEAPESELLLVKFEENFCGTNNNPNGTENSDVYDPYGSYEE